MLIDILFVARGHILPELHVEEEALRILNSKFHKIDYMLSSPVNIAHACTSKSFQWHCPTLKVLIDILLVAWGHILAKLHVEEKDSILYLEYLNWWKTRNSKFHHPSHSNHMPLLTVFFMISIHVWTIDVEFDPMLV